MSPRQTGLIALPATNAPRTPLRSILGYAMPPSGLIAICGSAHSWQVSLLE